MPHDPQNWPDVLAQPVPDFDSTLVPPDLPLKGLGKGLFFALLALGKELGQTVPDISPDAEIKGAEGIGLMRPMFGHMFPHLDIPSYPTTSTSAQLQGMP